MGTINYKTNKYITMGIRPYDVDDFTDENEIDYDLISIYYDDDRANVQEIIDRYAFNQFSLSIEPGYYEGFTLDINYDFLDFLWFDEEERQEALQEVEQLKKCLVECAGIGLVACFPGWCTGYRDYNGTLEEIQAAIDNIIDDIKTATSQSFV